MATPRLSVLIPCFNNALLLPEMLDCCIRQTYKEFEVIIVDDQSTDNGATVQMLEKYSAQDPRIKFFIRDREPKGSVTCRNIALQNSQGEYIIHFDADDLISDTCFEKRVAFMDSHPDCDYASFPAMQFSDPNKLPKFGDNGRKWGVECYGADLLESFLSAHYSFCTWSNIYRKSSIKSVVWDENVKICTDFSFMVPCILKGLRHQFSGLQELDYYYRVGLTGNMCADFVSLDKVNSTVYLINRTIEQLKEREDADLRKKQYFRFLISFNYRLLRDCNKEKIDVFMGCVKLHYPKNSRLMSLITKVSMRLKRGSLNNAFVSIIYHTIYKL